MVITITVGRTTSVAPMASLQLHEYGFQTEQIAPSIDQCPELCTRHAISLA